MTYLQPSEYETYGLEATTPAALVAAASSLIDSHCRRPTLAVAQYVERVRLRADCAQRPGYPRAHRPRRRPGPHAVAIFLRRPAGCRRPCPPGAVRRPKSRVTLK